LCSEDQEKDIGGFIDSVDEIYLNRTSSKWYERAWEWIGRKVKQVLLTPRNWIYLIVLGILTATFSYLVEWNINHVNTGRRYCEGLPFWTGYPLALLWSVVMGLISVACTFKLSGYAKGSGTPEIKTILSGNTLAGPLSLRCFIAKFVGLVTAMSAGLSIGREGPFIHMACILGYNLTFIPYFSAIRKNERLLRQMLAAAVSAGVTATFGAPIGGVLFGIEITSTYYMVNNMWRSFACSVVCVVIDQFYTLTKEEEMFQGTGFQDDFDSFWVIFSYCVLAIMSGFIGGGFVVFVSGVQKSLYRMKHVSGYLQVAAVALVTMMISFPVKFLNLTDIEAVNELFQRKPLADDTEHSYWDSPSIYLNLPIFFVLKFIFTGVAISLPISCGLYTPTFAIGAVVGRWYGEIMVALFPSMASPGAFAVVGNVGL
jgi:chloride channel 2